MARWQRILRRLMLAAVAGTMLAGCTGLPTSGMPEVVGTVVDQPVTRAPQGPNEGQQPEQVVREFIHALALTDYDSAGESFVAARQFLTPAARRSWLADTSTTPVVVLADDFAAVPATDDPSAVTVIGRQIGALEPDRSYRPVDAQDYQVTMHLEQRNGRWHIDDPPSAVLITEGDFSTAFRRRAVYFLDSTGRVVVPDLRYIPVSQTPDLSANRLMDLLLGGPSRMIAGAARTQLGSGAHLQSNVSIDDNGIAHVDLAGVDVSTPPARQALAAQIVWTLDTTVQRIAITVNGLPLSAVGATEEQPTTPTTGVPPESVYSLAKGALASFSPDAVPGSAQAVSDAYYIDDGVILRLSDSSPMWGSVGTGSINVMSASLSAASGALAAVVLQPDGSQRLIVGRPFEHVPTVTALEAATLTTPSFTRWGYSAWTVQNGATQPEIYQVSVAAGNPTWSRVAAPALGQLGPVTALALSPDGVRVAVVASGKLYMGALSPVAVSKADPAGDDGAAASSDHRRLQLTGLTVLRADLTDVGPITWDDSVALLVGAKMSGSRHRTVFEVSVDGQSVDPVTAAQEFGAVFGDVTAIASSGSDLPLLISYGGRVWQLQGSRANGHWVPPEGRNWMSGTEPFYPN